MARVYIFGEKIIKRLTFFGECKKFFGHLILIEIIIDLSKIFLTICIKLAVRCTNCKIIAISTKKKIIL